MAGGSPRLYKNDKVTKIMRQEACHKISLNYLEMDM